MPTARWVEARRRTSTDRAVQCLPEVRNLRLPVVALWWSRSRVMSRTSTENGDEVLRYGIIRARQQRYVETVIAGR